MKGRRTERIETRDPETEHRDPQPVTRLPVVRVPLPQCPKCGHTVFRSGGTSFPNVGTAEMFRYRVCANCKTSHYQAHPMTPVQKAEYGVPS